MSGYQLISYFNTYNSNIFIQKVEDYEYININKYPYDNQFNNVVKLLK